jgi:hypothetical protein
LLSEHFIEFMFIGSNVLSYPVWFWLILIHSILILQVQMLVIFLLAMAVGAALFSLLSIPFTHQCVWLLLLVHYSFFSFAVLALFKYNALFAASVYLLISIGPGKHVTIGACVCFAVAFGFYLPCIAVIRAIHVPENYRYESLFFFAPMFTL